MHENKAIKFLIVPGFLLTSIFLFRSWYVNNNQSALIISLLLVAACLAFIVKRKPLYSFENNYLAINGAINKHLHYNTIEEVRRISVEELGFGVKAGIQGPDIKAGYFYFDSIGNVLVDTTNDEKMVLIRTSGNLRVIISPADPNDFINILRNLIAQQR